MFDRFIRLARARKALHERRYEDALLLADDPLIRGDRGAAAVLAEARACLLARARQRLAGGDLAAARLDLERLRRSGAGAEVDELQLAVDAGHAAAAAALDLARQNLAAARDLLARGDLAAAEALLGTIAPGPLLPEVRQLQQLLAERRRGAAQELAPVEALVAAGRLDEAMARYARALVLDRDGTSRHAASEPIARRGAEAAVARVHARLDSGLDAALQAYRDVRADWPFLAEDGLRPAIERLGQAALAELRGAAAAREAMPLAGALRGAGLPLPGPLGDLVDAVLAAEGAGGAADTRALQALLRAAAAAGAGGLAAEAERRLSREREHGGRIEQARQQLATGQLEAARETLTAVLVEHPLHDGARRELDVVEKGLADLDQRLEAARAAAREGRLRAACAAAAALAGNGRVGAAAQLLAGEVRSRMAVVDRGLDEVRAALHGRAAATTEGVRHSLRRLQELAKVQCDHADLPVVTEAVTAEVQALETCERLGPVLDRRALAEARTGFDLLLAARARLLAPERLDARLFRLLDQLAQAAQGLLAAGRLGEVEVAAAVLDRCASVRAEFGARAGQLREAAAAKCAAAQAQVAEARCQLGSADLAEAERLAELAAAQWADGAPVRALAAELRQLRQHDEALARVEDLAAERDFQTARQELADLSPTPPLLRTRIYDMKQNLARAQGLEGAFLLRVDEGGEHLVLRGETVSIGNVRQTRSDLPVLADLAGRHASVRRSMSFHGGMQDSVVAEEGEVRVGGRAVAQHRLEAGDRVQLGTAFAFVYHRPSARSLTAGLQLQGGFQVGGTDRILLLKDRGRDGRILIGPGRDVHVRVPAATGEVELYANPTGQMRVHSDAGGAIDGVAFRGEHPVSAGQIVEAAGVSFVLQPWRPGP
ncbi:MAG: hypothetical protein FJ265_03005 [Planctomycetes bacterium]|nr:hypothetical protein [Planctomycetota bacterium]